MNIKIVQNKYLNALFLLMLFSAMVHMAILVVLAVIKGDGYILNYFNILDIDLLLGGSLDTLPGNALATAVAVGMYFAILKLNKS